MWAPQAGMEKERLKTLDRAAKVRKQSKKAAEAYVAGPPWMRGELPGGGGFELGSGCRCLTTRLKAVLLCSCQGLDHWTVGERMQ